MLIFVRFISTVVLGFSVLGFRTLCIGNQIWICVMNLPGFSALPGFKAPFHGDRQSALNPGTTVLCTVLLIPLDIAVVKSSKDSIF